MADVSTAAEGGARPGWDCREWISLGIVDAMAVTEEGVYLDCTTQPRQRPVRAKLASWFVGAGRGAYAPLPAGAQVLLLFPDGMPDAQAIAIPLPNEEETLPPDAVTSSQKVVIRLGAGQSFEIQCPSGELHIDTSAGVRVTGGKVNSLNGYQYADANGVTFMTPVHAVVPGELSGLIVGGGIVIGYTVM